VVFQYVKIVWWTKNKVQMSGYGFDHHLYGQTHHLLPTVSLFRYFQATEAKAERKDRLLSTLEQALVYWFQLLNRVGHSASQS